jgi:predicted N-acetyltransferase YhbS
MPLGFEKVAYGALTFPGPVDPARVLVVPIAADAHERLRGVIHWRPEDAHSAEDVAQSMILKTG